MTHTKVQRKKRTKASDRHHRDDPTGFYRRALDLLRASKIPFMVGGAYAFARYTGIHRDTCDFDVFVSPEDAPRTLAWFADHGFRTRLTFPHWLGKIYHQRRYVDVIYSSGNGIATVDPRWFEHATPGTVLGRSVLLCPPEEMIWSKSFIMERERFDGADVLHLMRSCDLDWDRLLERFGHHGPVLLAHVLLFQFVYPAERDRIPRRVVKTLAARIDKRENGDGNISRVCRGTLLSREQYLADLVWGYDDARRLEGVMTAEAIARWTAPIANAAARVRVDPLPGSVPRKVAAVVESLATLGVANGSPAAPHRDARRNGRSRPPGRPAGPA